ncbi:hypothetical protein SCUCBS95973_007526, partial [Sporothrix curviconia]
MYGAHFAHMLLLSFCGEPLWRTFSRLPWKNNWDRWDDAIVSRKKQLGEIDEADEAAWQRTMALKRKIEGEQQRTLREVEAFGVVHGDIRAANLLWNEDLQRVMLIDFDRAVLMNVKKRKASGKRRVDGKTLPVAKRA